MSQLGSNVIAFPDRWVNIIDATRRCEACSWSQKYTVPKSEFWFLDAPKHWATSESNRLTYISVCVWDETIGLNRMFDETLFAHIENKTVYLLCHIQHTPAKTFDVGNAFQVLSRIGFTFRDCSLNVQSFGTSRYGTLYTVNHTYIRFWHVNSIDNCSNKSAIESTMRCDARQ